MEAPLRRASRRAVALPAAVLAAAALGLGACASHRLSARPAPGFKPVAGVPSPSPTPAPAYPQTRPVDQSRPVKVRSRSLRYDQQAQETVFYGGVTATQDSTVLMARELRSQTGGESAHASGGVDLGDEVRRFRVLAGEADYTDQMREAELYKGVHLVSVDPYGRPVTVTGQSGRYSGVSRWAEVDGGVTVVRGAMLAKAVSATVMDGGSKLELDRDVRMSMGINRLQSQKALFDQKLHSMDLEGDVRARLIPFELRSMANAPWSVSPPASEGK